MPVTISPPAKPVKPVTLAVVALNVETLVVPEITDPAKVDKPVALIVLAFNSQRRVALPNNCPAVFVDGTKPPVPYDITLTKCPCQR